MAIDERYAELSERMPRLEERVRSMDRIVERVNEDFNEYEREQRKTLIDWINKIWWNLIGIITGIIGFIAGSYFSSK